MKKISKLSLIAATSLSPVLSPATAYEPPHDDHIEEIVVSGAFEGKKLGETILGATVIKQEALHRMIAGSIGETLKSQPGMSSTFFGPGASRPIIRGLGGDRIRVLDNGIGSIDASSTSPDHAVAVDPIFAERIEILRGSAMLMYGSSAAGGVVNILDERIPTKPVEGGHKAGLRYGFTSVDDGHDLSGAFAGNLSDKVTLYGDFLYRDTEDYSIPGYAESAGLRALEDAEEHDEHEEDGEDGHEEGFGTVENTATRSKSVSAGGSYFFDDGFLGFNLKHTDNTYGVPGHAHHGDEHEEDHEDDHEGDHHDEETEEDHAAHAGVNIALKQTRFDMNGAFDHDFLMFKKAKVRVGYADYEHKEIEDGDIGTIFTNSGFEGRLDLIDQGGTAYGDATWGGASGLHVKRRNFDAVGAEAFVPGTTTEQIGLYSVKEITFSRWQADVGARLERTTVDPDNYQSQRKFTGLSLSSGVGRSVGEDSFMGVNIARTARAPSPEALFSNGPHLATQAYERGNPLLDTEKAIALEGTFNTITEDIEFVANIFWTHYDNFIFEAATGLEADGLPVFVFQAEEAKLYGFEVKFDAHLGTMGSFDLHLDSQVDYVRAKRQDDAADSNLPRIPPLSALIGLDMDNDKTTLRAEWEHSAAQKKITGFELPTSSYNQINLYAGYRPFADQTLSIDLKVGNLFNTEARQHTSFLKDLAPLPGRNVRLSLRTVF